MFFFSFLLSFFLFTIKIYNLLLLLLSKQKLSLTNHHIVDQGKGFLSSFFQHNHDSDEKRNCFFVSMLQSYSVLYKNICDDYTIQNA